MPMGTVRALAIAALAAVACVRADHAGHDHSGHDTGGTGGGGMGSGDAPESAHASHGGSGSGSSGTSASMDGDMSMPKCVKKSDDSSCKDYTYPDSMSLEDVDSLCDAMPFMVVCGLRDECEQGGLGDSSFCEPFRLLATGCADKGMSGMAGCTRYNSLCDGKSVVAQCEEEMPVPDMLNTMPTQEMIVASCSTHSMPGCEDCTGVGSACPNTLRSAATVCNSMNMEVCAPFYKMCSANGDGLAPFCDPAASSSSGSYDPPMRMYFHTGIRDMVLWRNAVAANDGEYAGIWIAVLVTGLIATALRLLRGNLEALGRMKASKITREQPDVVASRSLLKMDARSVMPHVGRSFLSFVVITLDYALMLIAMTFNVGLFFAVVVGLALGLLLFQPVASRYLQRAQARELQQARKCDCADAANMEAQHVDGMKAGSGDGGSPDGTGPCVGASNGKMCCDTKTALAISESAEPSDATPSCCA